MKRTSTVAAGLLLGVLGCTSFPEVEANECGNVVLEFGEACDTLVDGPSACRPPGDPHECQFDCSPLSDGSLRACPEGYGCGSDYVCRIDSGDYALPLVLSAEATDWLSSADFDGDGRRELVSSEVADQFLQARFRVHYFDVDGSLQETRVFPRGATRPVARDMNGDGGDDLLFSTTRSGIGMVASRADREWLPSTFSSYQIPDSSVRVVTVRRDLVGSASPLVALTTRGAETTIRVPDYLTAQLEPVASLPAPVQALAGDPIAADLVEGADSPCAELVLAYRSEPRIHVFDMCEVTVDPTLPEVLWRQIPVEQSVRLPEGFLVASGPLAADVNGDGHLDLIVGATNLQVSNDALVRMVALGDGQSFEPEARELELLATSPLGFEVSVAGMPLAAGDLSGDNIADFVFPTFVVTSRPRLGSGELRYFVAYENSAQPWTRAEINDFNDNGFPDIVANTMGQPGLIFVNGSDRSNFVGTDIATDGAVNFVTSGDFDGDSVRDLAFVEGGNPSEQSDYLAIAFGNGQGAPSVGVRIAAVEGVQQLGTASDLGLEALFLVTHQDTKGAAVSSLTLFDGSPQRLPIAPYALVTFTEDQRIDSSSPLALMTGSFVKPHSNDVLAFGFKTPPFSETEYSPWLVPDIAGSTKPPVKLKGTFVQGATALGGGRNSSVSGAAMDLDGDGIDEALWLLPETSGSGCVLFTYDIDVRTSKTRELDRLRFDEPCPAPQVRILNLDHEVASVRPSVRPAVAVLVGAPARLRILWSDGSGRLSLEQSSSIRVPGDEAVKGFDLSPDSSRLAIVTGTGLFVSDRKNDGGAGHPNWGDIQLVAKVQDAKGVALIDPNSDRVPAIAVAGAEGILLFEAALSQ